MQGNAEIIELLNEVLTAELTAINQYFVHAKMCENWGFRRLAEVNRHESIDEMKDADALIERILYLDGLPNLQRLGKVNVGESVEEMLQIDHDTEANAIAVLNRGIAFARNVGDNGTAELLEDILEGEEEHADWIEAQQEAVKQMGIQNYLAQQLRKES